MSETAIRNEVSRDSRTNRSARSFAIRLAMTTVALIVWFWTQSLIGARSLPNAGIGDLLHTVTTSANSYLHAHPALANFLLIVSSGVIDLLGIFLLARWIFSASIRPFLGLVIVLGLRQIMQWLVALPAPRNAIWHYPGFPSLLVTYGVSNDYFFSGHTAIAVLGVTEIARMGRRWLTALGVLIIVFEIATVLILRVHYTMDVFTGIMTGLYAAHLAGLISTKLRGNKIPEEL